MKILKRTLIGLVVAAAAVIVAVYAVLANLDFEDLRVLAQDQVRETTGRELVIAGDVDLKISLDPAITMEQVTFANAPWGSREAMMTVKRFELEVRLLPLLSGDIVVKRLVVVQPDILLETNAEGLGNWVFDEAAATQETSPASGSGGLTSLPTFNKLLLRDGQGTYIDGESGQQTRIALGRVEASNKGFGTDLTIALEGRYNDTAFSVEGLVGPLRDLASGETWPLDVTAKLAGAVLTAKGTIQSGYGSSLLDLDFTAAGDSLADLSPFAGSDLPPLGPYKVSGKATGAGEAYSIKGLAAASGQSDLTGNIDLTLDGDRPKVAGNFIAKLIDLEEMQGRLQGGSKSGGGESDTSAGGGSDAPESPYIFTAEPLPFDALKGVDADVQLAVSTLRLPNKLTVQDLNATLTLAAGKLRIEPLRAGLSGGKVESSVSLDAGRDEPTLSLKLEGRAIDYGHLLRDLDADGSLSGKLDVTLDLKSRGESPRAHASSTSGLMELISQEGQVDDQLFKILAVGLGDILGPLMGGQQQARVNCIVARFDVTDGQARSRGLVFDSEALSVVGQGGFDLRNESLKLDFDTATRQASLASLAVPFEVRGTFNSPRVTPDPLGAAVGVAESLATTGIETTGTITGLVSSLFGGDSGGTSSGGDQSLCQAALAARQRSAPKSSASEPATEEGSGNSTAIKAPGKSDDIGDTTGGDKGLGEALGDFKKDLNKIFGGD